MPGGHWAASSELWHAGVLPSALTLATSLQWYYRHVAVEYQVPKPAVSSGTSQKPRKPRKPRAAIHWSPFVLNQSIVE
jgi:hypothetical protein